MAGDTAFSELLLAMGLRSFSMHPSQIVAVKERILATDAGRWCASLPRILAADDPERECVAAAASSPRKERPFRKAVRSSGSGLRNCAIVAPLVLLQSGASELWAHRGLGRFSQTGLTGLSKTCQNRGLR
jgi:hypothetical protein